MAGAGVDSSEAGASCGAAGSSDASLSHTGARHGRPPILRISRVACRQGRGLLDAKDRASGCIVGI